MTSDSKWVFVGTIGLSSNQWEENRQWEGHEWVELGWDPKSNLIFGTRSSRNPKGWRSDPIRIG